MAESSFHQPGQSLRTMSYPFDDHDDDVDEYYQFQLFSIFDYCGHSLISHLYIICYTFSAEMIYGRELDKNLFNSEKPQQTDPTAN